MLLFPAVSAVTDTRTSYWVLSVVQVFVLALHPLVSTLNSLGTTQEIAVLYGMISTFHIIRSILFKYPILLFGLPSPHCRLCSHRQRLL